MDSSDFIETPKFKLSNETFPIHLTNIIGLHVEQLLNKVSSGIFKQFPWKQKVKLKINLCTFKFEIETYFVDGDLKIFVTGNK